MKITLRFYILLFLFASLANAQPLITLKRAHVVNWPTVEVFYELSCTGVLNITHTAADLSVEEDGLPVSGFSITSPDTTQHHPMSVALVFDASGYSGGTNTPIMQFAGTKFINKLNGTTDEAALVFFNTSVTLQQSMISAQATLRNQLSTLGYGGARAMIDGAHAGVLHAANNGQNPNKAVVLVSDGYDDASSYTVQDVIDLARANTVRVYTIGLGYSFDMNTLKTIADSTGGAFYNTPDTTQLKHVYSEIYEHISDAGRESRLTYNTSCKDGSPHLFALSVKYLCSGIARSTTAFIKPNDPSERTSLELQIANTEALAGSMISIPVTMMNGVTGILQPMALGFTFPQSVLQLKEVEVTGNSPLLNTSISLARFGNEYIIQTEQAAVINGAGSLLALKFLVLDRVDSTSCLITPTGAAVSSGCVIPVLHGSRVNVGIPPIPIIEVIGPSAVCQGDTVFLRVSREFDRYDWTTGDTARTIAVVRGRDVGVAVMDYAGRTAVSQPFKVRVFDAPEPKLSATGRVSLCSGGSLALSASGSYASYHWSTGETDSSVTVTSAGAYWVEVMDANDCHGFSDTVEVVLDEPSVVISADGPLIFCEGDTLNLRGSDGFTAWLWNNGGALQDLAVTASGQYFLHATNAAGCVAESDTVDVVVMPRPAAMITSDKSFTVCPDDSLTLDAQAGHSQYLWSTGETSRRIIVRTPGFFWVKVAGPNGCYSAPETVRILQPVRPVLIPGGTQVACFGEAVRVDAGPGYAAYRWNSGDTTRTVDLLLSGDYWVDATDAGGCVVRSDTVVLQIRRRIEPEITFEGTSTICEGDSLILFAPIGYRSYYWNTGETSSRIIVRNQGDYRVTVYDNEDCTGTSTDLSVSVQPRPMKPVFTRQDAVLLAPLASAYQWYRNGLPAPTATNRSYTVTSNGNYAVEVFNEFGCGTLSDEIQINVTSVEKMPDGFAFDIFPDPSDGIVNVAFESPTSIELRMDVVNVLGQTVASHRGQGSGALRHTFDLRGAASGLYMLRVETGVQVFTRRFVKN